MRALRRTAAAAVLAAAALAPVTATATADTPATGPSGQTLTVSQATDLTPSPSGTKVTVTGAGYDPAQGIYLAVCVLPEKAGEAPSPCLGGTDLSGSSGSSYWISNNPPDYAKDLVKPFTVEQDGTGGFTLDLTVKAKDGSADCTRARCAIVTRADHTHGADRGQDVLVPITFGEASTVPGVPAGTVRHSVVHTLQPSTGAALAAAADPANGRLYVSSGDGTKNWLTVYDTRPGTPVGVGELLELPAPATVLALTPDGSALYLGLSTRIAAYDTESGRLTDDAIPVQGSATLLATDGHALYVGDQAAKSVTMYELSSRRQLGEPAVFPFFPAGLAADAEHRTAYATYVGGAMENGSLVYRNILNALDGTTGAVTGSVSLGTTALGSMGVTVDPTTRTGYVANLAAGSVSVVDLAELAVTGTVPVGGNPRAMAYDPGTGALYVAQTTGSAVAVVDPVRKEVTETVPTGDRPGALTLDGTRHQLFTVASGTIVQAARQVSPTVTESPAAVTVEAGEQAAFTAAATGTPEPTVTWETSQDGQTWTPVEGATLPTLTVDDTTAELTGRRYRAVFANPVGSLRTVEAVLTVTAATPPPAEKPTEQPTPTPSPEPEPETQAGTIGGSSSTDTTGTTGSTTQTVGSGSLASTGNDLLIPLALSAAALAATGTAALIVTRRTRLPGPLNPAPLPHTRPKPGRGRRLHPSAITTADATPAS